VLLNLWKIDQWLRNVNKIKKNEVSSGGILNYIILLVTGYNLLLFFSYEKGIGGWGLEADFFKKGFKGLIVFNITTMVKNGWSTKVFVNWSRLKLGPHL
jgi:hypothetical protein